MFSFDDPLFFRELLVQCQESGDVLEQRMLAIRLCEWAVAGKFAPSGLYKQSGARVDPLDALAAARAAAKGSRFVEKWDGGEHGFYRIHNYCDPVDFLFSIIVSRGEFEYFRKEMAPPSNNGQGGFIGILFNLFHAKKMKFLPPSCLDIGVIEQREIKSRRQQARKSASDYALKSMRSSIEVIRRQMNSAGYNGRQKISFFGMTLPPGELPKGEGIDGAISAWNHLVGMADRDDANAPEFTALQAEWTEVVAEMRARDPGGAAPDAEAGARLPIQAVAPSMVQAPAPMIIEDNSSFGEGSGAGGFAGRPSHKPAFIAEMKRRHDAGQLADTLAGEARHLLKWGRETFPTSPHLPGNEKAIENAIRSEYRALNPSPIKRATK